jgi:hypothetical protein
MTINARKLLLAAAMLFVVSTSILAHAPARIEMKFDRQTSVLEIKLHHPVRDVSKHYVARVTVSLNDEERIEQKLKKQSGQGEQVVLFKLVDANSGDKISAAGFCNISGRAGGEMVVP